MKQEFYHTFGFKVMLSEVSLDTLKSKGVLSRTLVIQCFPGRPNYYIKEILNNHALAGKKQLYEELITLRKVFLLYRLLHFHDEFPEFSINLEGRDRELCLPLLQMSFNSFSKIRNSRFTSILHKQKNRKAE